MKLPQAFSVTIKQLVSRILRIISAHKLPIVLVGAAMLCSVIILTALHQPESQNVTATVNSGIPSVSAQQVKPGTSGQATGISVTPQPQTPVPKLTVKDLHSPLTGSQIRGTSKGLIWWSVFEDYRQHTGVDIRVAEGTKVVAAGPGTVSEIGNDPAYGKVIVLDHGNGLHTVYGELEQTKVKLHEQVKAGQALALVGKPIGGEADFEPHLHFEIWQNQNIINGK